MPGKRYSRDTKATALAAVRAGSSYEVEAIMGIPSATVRRWRQEIEVMNDSELDALIREKKRVMSGLWATLGVDALEFVQELRAAGDAKAMLSAATAAGICATKLDLLGQPKDVTPSATGSNPTIIVPSRRGTPV